jgi:hypothetical protein
VKLPALLLLWDHHGLACPGDAGEPPPPREQLPALEQELARLAQQCSGHAGYLPPGGTNARCPARSKAARQALFLDPPRARRSTMPRRWRLGRHRRRQLLRRCWLARTFRTAGFERGERDDALQRFDLTAVHPRVAGNRVAHRGSIALRLGHDSNLNTAPSRDTVILTLPGGDAILTLADRFRARGGAVAMAEANGQVVRPLEGGASLQVYGEARLRASPSASDTNYQQLQAVVARSEPLASGEALLSLGATNLHYSGSNLYQAVRLAASRDWRVGWFDGCRPGAGAETEWRRYPVARELDGQFLGASVGIWCGRGLDRLTLAARAGQDAAEGNRPGGDQFHADFRASWIGAVAGGSLFADLLLSRQEDASGYSPLLENGATRRIDRLSLRLEYAYPITPNWSVLGTVDLTQQRSNLPLFDISGRAVYLGVRWTPVR